MNRVLVVLIVILVYSQNTVAVTLDSGDLIFLNITYQGHSSWYSVVGNDTGAGPTSFSIITTPGGFSNEDFDTGSSNCIAGSITYFNLIFSTSPIAIINLSAGNLTQLTDYIGSKSQGGDATFKNLSDFTTGWGTLTNIPTTYTKSPTPNTFPLGYLQDQNGAFVFITPVLDAEQDYNGTIVDYQFMLPTYEKQVTTLYGTLDLGCTPIPPPAPTGGSAGSGTGVGGGTKITPTPVKKEKIVEKIKMTQKDKREVIIEVPLKEFEWGSSEQLLTDDIKKGTLVTIVPIGVDNLQKVRLEVIGPDGSITYITATGGGNVTFIAPTTGKYQISVLEYLDKKPEEEVRFLPIESGADALNRFIELVAQDKTPAGPIRIYLSITFLLIALIFFLVSMYYAYRRYLRRVEP